MRSNRYIIVIVYTDIHMHISIHVNMCARLVLHGCTYLLCTPVLLCSSGILFGNIIWEMILSCVNWKIPSLEINPPLLSTM